MEINVTPNFSYIATNNNIPKDMADWFLVEDKNAVFKQKNTKYHVNPYKSFLTPVYKKFLSGFVPLLVRDFPDIKINHKLCGNTYHYESCIKTDLRENQREAVSIALKKHRGIFWMATNSGKTYIIASLCGIYSRYCKKILVLTYGNKLINQTAKKLVEELGCPVGILNGQSKKTPTEQIIVASIVTLVKRHINFQENVLIIDECHGAGANWFFKYGQKSRAIYRFGFSGTALVSPEKKANFGLNRFSIRDCKVIGILGPILKRVTNQDLIANGYSVKPIINMHRCSKADGLTGYDYYTTYLLGWIQNKYINDRINKIVKENLDVNNRILILVIYKDHGNALAKMLNCRFIHGGTPVHMRDFLPNEQVLIASSIFDMGINTCFDSLILACGGKGLDEDKNPVRLLQRIGRGLRTTGKKTNSINIHDFVVLDSSFLAKHCLKRINAYEAEDFKIVIK